MIHTDNWVNVQEKAREHTDTYQAPSISDLDSIVPGISVKICNGRERFFVKVTEVFPNGTMIGLVSNCLVCGSPYNMGGKVRFHKSNIMLIFTPEYLRAKVQEMYPGKSIEEVRSNLELQSTFEINNVIRVPSNKNTLH